MKKFYNFINEIDFNIYPTDYQINNHTLNGNYIESYDFISKNHISYSVYFLITNEKNEKLSNGHFLNEYCDLNIPTIFFSLSQREFGQNFDDLTDAKEFTEVMGKVVYCILEYINKHDYNVYSIGEVDSKKQRFYNYYRKHFKDFNILSGLSTYYKNMAYYMIKLSEIKNENVSKIKLSDNCFLHIPKKNRLNVQQKEKN
ncbi:hypothetical protein M0Q97_10400 [Candidatus Dojkabacteria bacterium]|jgi:hypothetical protein|nr:hypothetical protein [Candidatus Dojkabacteria bacterium]